ncbi:MAG: tetratricopeptide repeat protein, partial [Nocardioides sp.]|nr:tetratricopeptide repeat protein [Nocardioides sp.]
GAPAAGGAAAGAAAYVVDVTEQNFQATIEASMTAPVLLVFYSPTRLAESVQMARDLATLAGEQEGRFLAALVDVDAQPSIAQAVQLESIPFVFAVLDGRPAPLIQDVLGLEELRTALTQVLQQLATQGMTGRHAPRVGGPVEATAPVDEDAVDPRYAPAEDAMGAGDYGRAVTEYQSLLNHDPADPEATAGLAMATLLQRTQGVEEATARAAAEGAPDDVDAQTLVADLDMLAGRVEDSFARLTELVRRSSGADRDRAREHLIGLFGAVGNDDPRVLKGRQNLASALY